MDIHNFLKTTKAFNIFNTDIKNNTLGHAYIIYGKDALTVSSMLELFAAALLCRSPLKPCLNCSVCSRIFSGIHPDCIKYPLKGEKISVEDIDNLTGSSNYRPSEGDNKIYMLLYGETMNIQSQNKLLKTFEEPTECTHILLGTLNIQNLLPTIRSRAKIIEIEQFSSEQVFKLLSGLYGDNEKSRIAAIASGGLIGKAVAMTEDEQYINIYNFIYGLLNKLESYDDVLKCIEQINSYKDKTEILDIMQLYFRDCLMFKTGISSLILNRNGIKNIEKIINYYEQQSLISFIENVNMAKRKLQLNCNPQAVFEILLTDIAESRLK